MRAPRPLGALVAGSFFALAKAQANTYGDPNDNGIPGQSGNPDGWQPSNGNGVPLPSGNPGDWPNPSGNGNVPSPGDSANWPNGNGVPPSPSNSGTWPNGNDIPGNVAPGNGMPSNSLPPAANSGSWPNTGSPSGSGNPGDWQIPDGSNAPAPSGGPAGWPNDPTCVMQGTTTIFVTVIPSSPANSSPSDVISPGGSSQDGSSPDGSSPDGSSPDGSSPDGSSPDGSSPDGEPSDTNASGTSPADGSTSGNSGDSPTPGGTSSSGAPPYGSSDGASPDGPSDPADNGSDEPQQQPSSSDGAGQLTNGPVKPFTTLTIDIWGTGDAPATVASDNSPQATSGNSGVVTDLPDPVPSSPNNNDPQHPGSGSGQGSAPQPNPDDNSSGGPGNTPGTAPAPNPAGGSVSGSGDSSSDPNMDGSSYPDDNSYGHPGESPVFVTDGSPEASAVNQGSPPQPQITSPNDVGSGPSENTAAPGGNGQSAPAPFSITIIGPDGQPTIVSHPWGDQGSQPGDQSVPTYAYASGVDAQTMPNPASAGVTLSSPIATNVGMPNSPGSGADDSGEVTCVTIIGGDGKPTVVDFTAGVPGTDATAGPASVSAVTDGSALAQSMTIIGADGKPTVVYSPWGNPNAPNDPIPKVTDAPGPAVPPGPAGNGNANGDSGVVTSGVQLPEEATTCVTVLGSDGKPTVVDWPWVIPDLSSTSGPLATAALSSSNGDRNGGVFTDASALPQTGPMTHASFTILGPDGLPTIVQTSWAVSPTQGGSGSGQGPIFSQASLSGLPSGISAQLPLPSGANPDGSPGPGNDATTCFTIIGADGRPTVVETTLAAPGATGGPIVGPGATLLPPSASNILSIPLPPFPDTASQPLPGGSGTGGNADNAPYTTCTSYTVLGSDGLPTVVDTTWVVPPAFETGSALATDASGPLSAPAGQITGAPGFPDANGAGGVTTCSTYTIIGPDGLPSAVETTFVVPSEASGALATDAHLTSGIQAAPWSAASEGPAPPSAGGNGPGAGSNGDGPFTTCITVMTTGADGTLTPVEQTVILPPASGASLPSGITDQSALPMTTAGLPGPSPTGPIIDNGSSGSGDNGDSNISSYNEGDPTNGDAGTIVPPGGPIFSGASADPMTAGEPTLTVTGTRTSTIIVIADPSGGPVISGPSGLPLSEYGVGAGAGENLPATGQAPGSGPGTEPSESTLFPAGSVAYGNANGAGIPVTSTWSNEVPEGTTTYLLKFPLTTLATLPVKRDLRRQASAPSSGNSTTLASSVAPSHTDASPAPSMCANGGNIGNRTVNFDSEKPGPLFNPSNELWFSEGFLIAPPSSQEKQSYFASSGGQLVEFVPASLTPTSDEEGSDIAEIGVGPNASKECYRFDLFGASLRCAAEGAEEWCEFEISAYRWNHETSREESIEWSETKRVPACANYPDGPCALTPVELDGYTNITGVLITLRVGLDLRAWWGDDFRYGWTDNSCEAAACRSGAATHRVKRETVETALRRGVWHWTPEGAERLDDDFIWDAVQ